MKEKKTIREDNELKKLAREKARRVQTHVKLDLQDWIAEGKVLIELKKIICNPEVKDADRIKAIELCCKLAGFESDPTKIAATDSLGNDIPYQNVDFEELKALWMIEMQTNNIKSIEENADFLLCSTDEEIDELIDAQDNLFE